MRCANCGGALPGRTRFCPHCSAPQVGPESVRNRPNEPKSASIRRSAPGEPRLATGRLTHSHSHEALSIVLIFLAAAIIGFAILTVALGWVGEEVLGL